MALATNSYTVKAHFEDRLPSVKETYDAIVRASRKFGPVKEEAKKTSIHLIHRSAFAGIATRKSGLILTLKSDSYLKGDRVWKRERASANRWHLD